MSLRDDELSISCNVTLSLVQCVWCIMVQGRYVVVLVAGMERGESVYCDSEAHIHSSNCGVVTSSLCRSTVASRHEEYCLAELVRSYGLSLDKHEPCEISVAVYRSDCVAG